MKGVTSGGESQVEDATTKLYRERIRTLTSTLPMALYITEPNAGFQGPRLLGDAIGGSLGFKPDAFRKNGQLWVARIHPDDLPDLQETIAGAARTGSLAVKYRWRCGDGTEKLFLDRGVMTSSPASLHRNLIGICLDITQRDKLSSLLAQYGDLGIVVPRANGNHKDLLHDFNNLLTVIIWNLERAVWRMNGVQSPRAKWTALRAAMTTVLIPRNSGTTLAEKTSADPKRGWTVLLVEDDRDVRDMTVARLEDMGHRVLETDSATSALGMLAEGATIDLMLADINLPGGMNGADLARHARRLHPRIKLLFVSGSRPPREIERNLSGEILLKPYRREELTAAMARAAAGSSSSREQRETRPPS